MKPRSYQDILDSAAGDSLSNNTNLWPPIASRIDRKPLKMTLRTQPILSLLIALLVLFALSGVVYALGRAFGYIPGVGLVDQSSPIRVLAKPVTMEKKGISVTVSEVIADSTRTFISFRVDGIPRVETGFPTCITIPELHLPDGTNLGYISGGDGIAVMRNGNFMYYGAEYVFSPIQNGTNAVTFILPCVLPDGNGPENWEIPLKLVSAPPNFATPAIEIGATYSSISPRLETTPIPTFEKATPSIIETSSLSVPTATPAHAAKRSGLSLEKVLELADSYIFIGKFTDAGDLPEPLDIWTSSDSDYLPHIEDANGNPVSFKVRTDARPDPDWGVAYYWAYEVPKPVIAPITITVDRVNIRKYSTAQINFDTRDHPKTGQQWDLNLPVKLGSSDFVVDSITFLGNGYRFNISSENLPEGVTPEIEICDSSLNPYTFDGNSSTVDNTGNKAMVTITLTSKSPPPIGNLTVNWGLEESIPQSGPWSLKWTPTSTDP